MNISICKTWQNFDNNESLQSGVTAATREVAQLNTNMTPNAADAAANNATPSNRQRLQRLSTDGGSTPEQRLRAAELAAVEDAHSRACFFGLMVRDKNDFNIASVAASRNAPFRHYEDFEYEYGDDDEDEPDDDDDDDVVDDEPGGSTNSESSNDSADDHPNDEDNHATPRGAQLVQVIILCFKRAL